MLLVALCVARSGAPQVRCLPELPASLNALPARPCNACTPAHATPPLPAQAHLHVMLAMQCANTPWPAREPRRPLCR